MQARAQKIIKYIDQIVKCPPKSKKDYLQGLITIISLVYPDGNSGLPSRDSTKKYIEFIKDYLNLFGKEIKLSTALLLLSNSPEQIFYIIHITPQTLPQLKTMWEQEALREIIAHEVQLEVARSYDRIFHALHAKVDFLTNLVMDKKQTETLATSMTRNDIRMKCSEEENKSSKPSSNPPTSSKSGGTAAPGSSSSSNGAGAAPPTRSALGDSSLYSQRFSANANLAAYPAKKEYSDSEEDEDDLYYQKYKP